VRECEAIEAAVEAAALARDGTRATRTAAAALESARTGRPGAL
jgi:hypothetical protein